MDIRKVEEKEMKIHTRDGPKLKRRKKERSYLKKPKLSVVSGIRRVRANSEASIKLRDHALYTLGRARDKAFEQLEGGEELRDAAEIIDTAASSAFKVTDGGIRYSKDSLEKMSLVLRKKRIKSKETGRRLLNENVKRLAKEAAKKTAKDTSKEVSKDMIVGAVKVTTEIAATAGAEATAAAVGTTAGPEGTLLGMGIGMAIGEKTANEIEMKDNRISGRLRKLRWFMDKTKAEEEQKDSFFKMMRDIAVRDLVMLIKVNKSFFVILALLLSFLIFMTAVPLLITMTTIYNSPLAVFFPSPETGYDDIRTVLSSYYMDFNKKVIELEESGSEITYQNIENDAPVSNFNDTLMVYMILYGDGKAGFVMDDENKKNLKKIFDEMNYIDDSSTTVEKEVGDSLGKVWVTAYCPCAICCGPYANGITASGKAARAKHTIAVDAYNPIVPMGTKVVIEGIEYTVEDTGDLNHYGNDFDIFYAKHEDCLQWGRKHVEAFLAEGNGNKVKVTSSGTVVHNLTYKDYMAKKKLNKDQEKMLSELMDSDLWDKYYSGAAGQTVAQLALTKVGCKYDQNRRMEEGYYDCSSLVYRLYKEVGIELPYVADTQGKYCYENAMIINKADLKPGDLIFYSYEENGCFRNISHVAIYVGKGMMVHAAGVSRGVVLDPLRDSNVVFYARPYK